MQLRSIDSIPAWWRWVIFFATALIVLIILFYARSIQGMIVAISFLRHY
ncbi:MAG: hypothetical protein WC216_02720 [Gallionella sp.]|jgi:hypothetical protein